MLPKICDKHVIGIRKYLSDIAAVVKWKSGKLIPPWQAELGKCLGIIKCTSLRSVHGNTRLRAYVFMNNS